MKLRINNECPLRQHTMICFYCWLQRRFNTGNNHAGVKICHCYSKRINRKQQSVAYLMKDFFQEMKNSTAIKYNVTNLQRIYNSVPFKKFFFAQTS